MKLINEKGMELVLVLCKDCIHYNEKGYCTQNYPNKNVDGNWFCGSGEQEVDGTVKKTGDYVYIV